MFQDRFEPGGEALKRPVCRAEGLDSLGRDGEDPPGAAAALLGWILHDRPEAALAFEALEGGVERAACDGALGALLDQAAERHGVSVLLQVEDGEEHGVFEVTQVCRHVYNAVILCLRCRHSKVPGGR